MALPLVDKTGTRVRPLVMVEITGILVRTQAERTGRVVAGKGCLATTYGIQERDKIHYYCKKHNYKIVSIMLNHVIIATCVNRIFFKNLFLKSFIHLISRTLSGASNQFEYYMDPEHIRARGLATTHLGPGALIEGTLRHHSSHRSWN